MRVFFYLRVSTKRQESDGESLEVQLRKLQGYAMQKGWDLESVKVFKDSVSGSIPLDKRPSGKKLMKELRAGDVLIVAKMDRMSRSIIDSLEKAEYFREQDIDLHLLDLGGSLTGSEGGVSKLIFNLLAVVADFERSRIIQRVLDTKAFQKENNRYQGGYRPFGFRITDEGNLEPEVREQKLKKEIVKLRREGYSLRKTLGILQARGRDVNWSRVWRTASRAEKGV